MDRTERFQLIDQMLSNRKVVSRQQFLTTLEISLATFKRDIEYMRDRLGAPIVWQRELNGYVYEQSVDQKFQMPGLWFNTSEIHALMTMDALLENLQQGMLSQHIKPLQARIRSLLDQGDYGVEEVSKRIRVLTVAAKSYKSEYFQVLNQALLSRKRLHIEHYNRSQDAQTKRMVSPQRLTFYRDNWYLDAWCHERNALRSFAVDAIQSVEISDEISDDINDELIDKQLSSGYGIFSGANIATAILKFTPQRARWVSRELWHPNQQSSYDEHGFYMLKIPYSQPTELIMDILKFGSDVEVLSPKKLRDQISSEINKMQLQY